MLDHLQRLLRVDHTEDNVDLTSRRDPAADPAQHLTALPTTSSAEMPVTILRPGTMIDSRFTIIGPGVVGGMGVVYPVRHPDLVQKRAIKMLHRHVLPDPYSVARFRDEAEIMLRMQHPSIVRVFDFANWNRHAYLVMEWMEGGNLRAFLNSPATSGAATRLPLTEVVSLIRAVAGGVAHAHDRGILHLDLKPENILLDAIRDGRPQTPKVADFGLARVLGQARPVPGAMAGTAPYMAPEQRLGLETDVRADVYGLGAVLYELLCERPPMGSFRLPTELDSTLPGEIDTIVQTSLASEPADRFPAVYHFDAALARLAPAFSSSPELAAPIARPRARIDPHRHAQQLLAIIKEITDGGKDLIPNWTLFSKMKALADRGDVEGMYTYYERCLRHPKGRATRRTLERRGRRTLESEWGRFRRIYQSPR